METLSRDELGLATGGFELGINSNGTVRYGINVGSGLTIGTDGSVGVNIGHGLSVGTNGVTQRIMKF